RDHERQRVRRVAQGGQVFFADYVKRMGIDQSPVRRHANDGFATHKARFGPSTSGHASLVPRFRLYFKHTRKAGWTALAVPPRAPSWPSCYAAATGFQVPALA